MSITVDEQTTLADIDEALSFVCETIKGSSNPQGLTSLVDGLLDERLAKSK